MAISDAASRSESVCRASGPDGIVRCGRFDATGRVAECATFYRPRHPERTAFHRLIEGVHWREVPVRPDGAVDDRTFTSGRVAALAVARDGRGPHAARGRRIATSPRSSLVREA
jgi:hypothetical protein